MSATRRCNKAASKTETRPIQARSKNKVKAASVCMRSSRRRYRRRAIEPAPTDREKASASAQPTIERPRVLAPRVGRHPPELMIETEVGSRTTANVSEADRSPAAVGAHAHKVHPKIIIAGAHTPLR